MSSMNSNALPNDSTSTSTDSTRMISKIISPSLATATTSDDSLTGLSASELTDLSCVAQSVPLMLYTYTVNHDSGECNFPFVSDYCEEIFGLPASKVVEDSEAFVNLIHPDDVKEFAASVLESMINLTPWDHKMRMKDIDSRIVYIHGKSTPRRRDIINQDGSNSKFTIWYGALSDITNNYNEEESKISESGSDGDSDDKYENTSTKERCLDPCPSQSSYLPCFELDKDGTITSWNKHMTELTIGLLEQDVKGEHVKSIVPDTHQGKNEVINFISAINHVFIPLSDTPEQGNHNRNHNHNCFNDQVHELTVLSKTGTEINLRISCEKSRDNNTLACTCTDVTVLKQAEKEKIDALRLLDAEKNLTEWLSHEIRNPLSIAMEAAQSLREEFESNYFPTSQTTEKLDQIYETNNMDNHSYVNLIIKSISYVVDLLSKMLDLNKVAEGKILLRPSICSLREDIIRPVQQMMQLKGNKVHISITGEDMNIYIDKLRLKQVITNLVSNAIKFTKEGFVVVHSYRTNKDVDGSDIPESLVISVSDSGVGVLQKNLMQLFSKWERLGSNVNGTGIGLCLSRFLVLAMKGQIYLNEYYDSGVKGSPGAQFILRFPMNVILASEKDGQRIHNVPAYVALSAAVKASNTEQVANLQQNITESIESDVNNLNNNSCVLGKYKILLVDDDKIVRKLLRRRFNRIFPQADITEADCGEKAIEYTSSDQHFDIIFIDQFMGDGLNGDATIRKLRENHVDSMIVGISGNSKEMCHITAGAEDFFQKPLPSQKQVIERLLRKLPPPAGWNVLVVDDSPLNCHFLKKKLYKVFTAHYTTLERAEKRLSITVSTSVKDAIFKLKGESFDLVVTGQEFSHDNYIKDLKGMDIISFVRDHSLNKNAIIVLNSAIAQSQHHPQQFDMYWPKPLPSDDRMRQTLCEELLQIKLDAKK